MEHVFGSIPAIVDDLEANSRIDEAVVFAAWTRCAGEQLDACTRPVEYRYGRLVVAVRDETWRRHLTGLGRQMVFKLNSLLGDGSVRSVEFRVSPAEINNRAEIQERKRGSVNKVPASLELAAGNINDEHLRLNFLDAAASYLARQTHGR